MSATVIVPTHNGRARLGRLLDSLAAQSETPEVIVVDNGSSDGTEEFVRSRYASTTLIRLPTNEGYSRAVNLAAHRAECDALVIVNDDVVCHARFVKSLVELLDPGHGIVMSAGVLLEPRGDQIIDTAGMELDPTLLVFDYLNGMSVEVLEDPRLASPIGPSGAAAAFDRSAFCELGGFDENLFAYWEDVDLVLRLRAAGARCALARDARGVHDHSATLGSGSARKNYLTGFGRGYTLRKWSATTRSRLPRIVLQDALICIGQALVDRNVSGVTGRIDGYRHARAVERQPFPFDSITRTAQTTSLRTLAPRLRRRVRLRRAVRRR